MPEFYMKFAQKMPKFYIIAPQKYIFPNLGGHVARNSYTYTQALATLLRQIQTSN